VTGVSIQLLDVNRSNRVVVAEWATPAVMLHGIAREVVMDRRLFLTGILGLAGATALAGVIRPESALAGVPNGRGILDELNAPDGIEEPDIVEEDNPEAEPINHRSGHRRRRRRRRREWRRRCRRYRHNGRWRRRCRRRRVWVWYWI
jgi:hypothetical protein